MPADQFWGIIERAARSDDGPAAHVDALCAELRKHTSEEIKSFEVTFAALSQQGIHLDLWGAAYVIHGGCPFASKWA
jgi:hypothetical protein